MKRPASAGDKNSDLGTAGFSGMIGVTLFGIFLTPVFFSVITKFFGPRPSSPQKTGVEEQRSRNWLKTLDFYVIYSAKSELVSQMPKKSRGRSQNEIDGDLVRQMAIIGGAPHRRSPSIFIVAVTRSKTGSGTS